MHSLEKLSWQGKRIFVKIIFFIFGITTEKMFDLRISKNETGDGRTEVFSPFLDK